MPQDPPELDTEATTAGLGGGGPGGPATFNTGDLVCRRYRVVTFLGRGGMGEVYEAVDLELGVPVALKALRLDVAGNPAAVERFKREVLLARTVTHPNVCRIFDIGYHAVAEGELSFLTMELLGGETLSHRIKLRGRLGPKDALPLAEQMGAALSAAHEAGIVHRDFKSANVMLVPWREGERAVVTDFGLARERRRTGGEASGDDYDTAGTPAYMAPEQVEGGTVGPSADVYAFGIVLYEMVTGHLPFVADTDLATAVKRLREAPRPPAEVVPGLDKRWSNVILRCLERDPAKRYASVQEAVQALRGPAARPLPRAALAATITLGLLAVAAAAWLARPPAPPADPAASSLPRRRSVAVLGFTNLSGRPEAAWLGTALSEMIGSELAVGGHLRLVPGEHVARTRIDLALGESDGYAPETLRRIRTSLGADLVVLGSYLTIGTGAAEKLRLDLRLQDAARGETLTTVAESAARDDLDAVVGRAGAALRQHLNLPAPAADVAGARRSGSLPRDPEAARAYAEGLARLRAFDALLARERLEEAISREPTHPLPHVALADVWSALGYDGRAAEAAKAALARAGALPREDRLWVEARAHEAARNWDRALDLYRSLFNFFPDDLETGLALAAAQTRAGRPKDAQATVEALRRLGPPLSDDVRLDLREAAAAASEGDFTRSRDAAARARVQAEGQGRRLVVAEARLEEAWALRNLGQPQPAREAAEAARQAFAEAKHKGGAAQATNTLAVVVRDQGDFEGAEKLDREALATFREIGDLRRAVWALNGIARGQALRGRWAEAGKAYEETIAICTEIGDRVGLARQSKNLAELLAEQGAVKAAADAYSRALAIAREAGDRRIEADALRGTAAVLLEEGRLEEAAARFQEARALAQEIGQKRYEAQAAWGLGEVARARGDAAKARVEHEAARTMRKEIGEKVTAGESGIALARLALDEGRAADALALASEASATFQAAALPPLRAQAEAVRAEALLALGRAREAADAAEGALKGAQGAPKRTALSITVPAARAMAASGASDARSRLEAAAAEAGRLGLRPLELEARLAVLRLDQKGGRAGAPAALAALAAEARAAGLLRLAAAAERP